jgi:hypothetical protein
MGPLGVKLPDFLGARGGEPVVEFLALSIQPADLARKNWILRKIIPQCD